MIRVKGCISKETWDLTEEIDKNYVMHRLFALHLSLLLSLYSLVGSMQKGSRKKVTPLVHPPLRGGGGVKAVPLMKKNFF